MKTPAGNHGGRRGPRHVAEGLNRVLGALGAPPADVVVTLFAQWTAIAGEELAEHSRPVRVVHRRLVVEVDDAAWAARVRLSESSLLARLAARVGEGKVVAVRPRVTRGTVWERSRRR